MSQIIELSRTSSHIYSVVVLTNHATSIGIGSVNLSYGIWYDNQVYVSHVGLNNKSELLGILNEITEEQAREITGGTIHSYSSDLVYLKVLVESKGIDLNNKIVIIKSEI